MTDLTSQKFPSDWELEPRYNLIYYATKSCMQKCICSKEEQTEKREQGCSIQYNWEFENYYDICILKHPKLCELYNEFAQYPLISKNQRYKDNWASTMNYNVEEVLVVRGPYSNDTPYFQAFTKITSIEQRSLLEKYGGLSAIKQLITTELAKDIQHSPTPLMHYDDTNEIQFSFVECTSIKWLPPAIIFIKCSKYSIEHLSSYVCSTYMNLRKRYQRIDYETLQHALKKTYLQIESCLEIKRYIKPAGKIVYGFSSKCFFPKDIDKKKGFHLLGLSQDDTINMVLQLSLIHI